MEIKVRDSEKNDVKFLKKWLKDPQSQKQYVCENEREANIAANMWASFFEFRASLTAMNQGEPIGIATLQLIPFAKTRHHSEVSIIVSPEYQRSGVGTLLIQELSKMAKSRFKMEYIYLHVYQGADSINFYKKMGFKKFGSQKHWVKDSETGTYRDRIWMEKEL